MGMTCLAAIVILGLGATLFAAEGGAGGRLKFISNFTDAEEVAGFKVSGARAQWAESTEDGALVEGVAFELEAVAGGAMHVVLLPGEPSATIEYAADAGMPADWSGFDTFVMNFENGSEFMINMHLWLADGAGREYFADNLWICRSRNRIDVPLREIRTAAGEPLDFSDMARMKLEIMSAEKFEHDLWLFKFRLEGGSSAVVAATERRKLLNFAPLGSRFVPGAELVTEKTAYQPWRGYGWEAGIQALTSTATKKLDMVVGNWLWADLQKQPALLRVDLPDGKYKGRFYGGNYNVKLVPLRSFELSVNGQPAAAKAVDPDTYYTADGHFLGVDNWYTPAEDPYDKYVTPFFQKYDFDFEVAGGAARFEWTRTLAGFALLVAPAEGDDFVNACRAVEDARRADFAENIEVPLPPVEKLSASDEEDARGFAVWSRPYADGVGIYDRPDTAERAVERLHLAAARGEREIAAVTVTPLRDPGEISVEVCDLSCESGGVIPASSIEVRALKYVWNGWPASLAPGYLQPTNTAPGFAGANRTFFLTLTAPLDAAPGSYEGTVTIAAAKGGAVKLPLEVDLRPFELTRRHAASFAWWRTSPYNMDYCLKYFLPEKMDYFRRLLDAEAKSLLEHGSTAYYFTPPILRGVKGTHVELDFSILDEEAAVCIKYGLCSAGRPGMIFTLPGVARHLMHETRYGDYMEPEDISQIPESDKEEEFSELFNARYIDACRQIHEYFESKGLEVLLYPADEPRERNTNRWNRNIEDTIRYCDMIHDNIPGARIYVDPMRDGNAGVDYYSLVEHVDVLGTHPWDQSSRFVEHCRREGRPDLVYFNAIMWDRYDFGLQVAAAGAKGFWQWHYQWDLVPFLPFHTGFKWGVTYPGPDGPLDKPRIEMVADAIDDYRYLATLEERMRAAESSEKAAAALAEARKTLDEFYAKAPPYPTKADYSSRPRAPRDVIAGKTLDQWRDTFAAHIIAINNAT